MRKVTVLTLLLLSACDSAFGPEDDVPAAAVRGEASVWACAFTDHPTMLRRYTFDLTSSAVTEEVVTENGVEFTQAGTFSLTTEGDYPSRFVIQTSGLGAVNSGNDLYALGLGDAVLDATGGSYFKQGSICPQFGGCRQITLYRY